MRRVFRLPGTARRIDDEVEREFAFHLEGRIEDIIAREGLSRDAAEREARRRFGDYHGYRQAARDIDQHMLNRRNRMDLLETIRRETRQAARALLRAPSFSVIAIVTLALGLAATTTVFTLLDRVVIRPLPYPNADRLVHVGTLWPKVGHGDEFGISRGQYFFFRQHSTTLQDLLFYDRDIMIVPGDGSHPAERVDEMDVSANAFAMLGLELARGRYFTTADERNPDGDPRVALISYEYWQRRFGGDPAIIGKRLDYGANPMTIIGVLAPHARILDATADVWIRNHLDPADPPVNNHTHNAIGLLKPGVTVEQAASDIAHIQQLMRAQYPAVYSDYFYDHTGFAMHVSALRDFAIGSSIARALWVLFGGVAVVLLIAAANVANLYLVRIEARRQEAAVRTALGADRAHLAVHYLSESLLLAVISAAAAIGLGYLLLHLVLSIAPQSLPRLEEVHLGWRSVAFCVAVSVGLGVAFGLVPLAARGVDVDTLREGARGLSTSRSRRFIRHGLVLAQIALGVVLLAAGGLMAKSFWRLRHVDMGFNPNGVQTMMIMLPHTAEQPGGPSVATIWQQIIQKVQTIPGVTHAGAGWAIPLNDGGCSGLIVDQPLDPANAGECMPMQAVTPGYFEALGMKVRGALPTWDDVDAGRAPLVVTQAFAKRFWGTENAIGRGVHPYNKRIPAFPVVGIASDIRSEGLQNPPVEEAYFSILGPPGTRNWPVSSAMSLVVRAPTLSQSAVMTGVRRVLADVAPGAPIADAKSMEHIVAESTAGTSFAMLLLLISAAIALSLSAVGIYGVISYIVAHRRREIGIRMALGAQAGSVARLVIGESVGVAITGAAIGVVLAAVAMRLLRSQLFEVSPSDPLVLAATGVALVVIALLSAIAPTRRATRIDPVEAIRAG